MARRAALDKALIAYVPPDRKASAVSFLSGLSMDELLFLAEFLGSSLLITSAISMDTWEAVSHQAQVFRRGGESGWAKREDTHHKLIVVSEFAACCGSAIRFR
jgi:hypothetical protein